MDNCLYVSFYLQNQSVVTKKHAIYLRITIAGKRERDNTGIWVMKSHWDAAKGRIRSQDYNKIKSKRQYLRGINAF